MTHTKIILAAFLALAFCGNVMHAQDNASRHEVSVTFQGIGLGSMPFKSDPSWDIQSQLSLGAGLGYTFWFNRNFGIKAGLRASHLSFNQEITNFDRPFSSSLPMSSLGIPGGSSMTTINLRSTATSVKEKQHYTFVEVPLMLAMKDHHLFLNLGVSLAKAVSATADYSYTDPACSISSIPELGVTPTSLVSMTLADATEGSVKNSDMPKPFFCLIAAEAGFNIPMGDVASLSIGLFGRFAPVASKTENAVEPYAIQSDATYHLLQPSTSSLVEKRGYYEAGLSLGLNFGIGNKKRSHNKPAMFTDNVISGTANADFCRH